MDADWGKGLSNVIDIQGFNYRYFQYDPYHQSHPIQPLIASETGGSYTDRGIYINDTEAGYVSGYDDKAPPWAYRVQEAWEAIATRDFISGGFFWTGFDYKGEPYPYKWPNINCHYGVIDIAGFPKDNYYYFKAMWGNQSTLHLFPHWNWKGKEGTLIDVWAYSNAQFVELFVNGQSQGKKSMPKFYHVNWQVEYASGAIEGRAYDATGAQVASEVIQTTGDPTSIKLTVEFGQHGIVADGQDIALVTGSILDNQGHVVPTASNEVSFSISGPGKILGLGNGDPSSHEPDKATERKAFNGLVRAIVQATQHSGIITLSASSQGLQSATVQITSQALILKT